MFAHDSLNNNLPSSLTGQLMAVDTMHSTRSASYKQLVIPTVRTNTYGTLRIKSKSTKESNTINLHFHEKTLHMKNRAFCKEFITKFLIDSIRCKCLF